MHRRLTHASVIVALALAGCGSESGNSGSGGGSSSEEERPEAFEDLRPHLDLLATAHLADVDYQGLFMDFGTAARMKYTSGGWKTGWGRDAAEGQTTYTH